MAVKYDWDLPIALALPTLLTQTPRTFRVMLVWDAGLLAQTTGTIWEIKIWHKPNSKCITYCLLRGSRGRHPDGGISRGAHLFLNAFWVCNATGKECSHCPISRTLLFLFWYPHWKDYTKLLDSTKTVKCFTSLRRGIKCILPYDTTDLMTPQTGWIFWDICTSELLPQAIPHYLLLTNEQSGGWFF